MVIRYVRDNKVYQAGKTEPVTDVMSGLKNGVPTIHYTQGLVTQHTQELVTLEPKNSKLVTPFTAEECRQWRVEVRGLSLSDAAKSLGVSRKTVMSAEKIGASLDLTLRMIEAGP